MLSGMVGTLAVNAFVFHGRAAARRVAWFQEIERTVLAKVEAARGRSAALYKYVANLWMCVWCL